jgi:hypothetical protein
VARPSTKILAHIRVFAIATVFGLAAYAIVRLLVFVSDRAGLLDWIKG